MYQKWLPEQHIIISMHEMFAWWDKLDQCKDSPEKAFRLFEEFLEECEDQLELNPDFIEEMQKLDLEEDFVALDLKDLDSFLDDL